MAFFLQDYRDSPSKTLFVIDNSLSMTVQDVEMDGNMGFLTRLDAAKKLANDFFEQKQDTSAEWGIVSFSRLPTLILPFTTDRVLTKNVVQSLTPVIYGGGSDLGHVIDLINDVYGNMDHLHIVVLSDGEFFDIKNMPSLKNVSAHVTFIGVGTENGGYMLQWYDSLGKPQYRQDASGKIVSRMDPSLLTQLRQKYSGDLAFLRNTEDIPVIINTLNQVHTVLLFPLFFVLMVFASGFLLIALWLLPYKKYSHYVS